MLWAKLIDWRKMFTITTKDAYEDIWCFGRYLPTGEGFKYENKRIKEIAEEIEKLEFRISELKYEVRQIYLSEND